MKKIILLTLIFGISFITIKAQNYHMLPDSNAVWVYAVYPSNPQSYIKYYAYLINGDTLVNNKKYVVIKRTLLNSPPYYFPSCPSYTQQSRTVLYYRNDRTNHKLYGIIPGDTTEYLLFDFNVNQGDTINVLSSGNNIWGGGTVLSIPYCDGGGDVTFRPSLNFTTQKIVIDSIYYTTYPISLKSYNFKAISTQTTVPNWYGIWQDKIGNGERVFWNGFPLTTMNINLLQCVSINDTIWAGGGITNPIPGRCDTISAYLTTDVKNYPFTKNVDIIYQSIPQKFLIQNLHPEKNYTFILNNTLGQNLFQQSFNAVSEYSIHLELPQGIYIAEIYNNSSPLLRKKIIIYDK